MKTKSIFTLAILALAITLVSFAPPAVTKYKVDTKQSTLVWTGKKVTGQHTGTISLASGEFAAEGTQIKSGSFDVDVASLADTDITNPEGKAKLERHLKSDDFFGVEKYPTANFVVSSVTLKSGNEYTVKGKLTIKGKTNDIEFPAVVATEGKNLVATARITVDRSKYDVRYGSKSFFDNLGDKYIDDEFQLDLKLVGVPNAGA
ncbi:MAG TPA: YceI family protein [Cyclobacteriaceae bacterium]|nr:YceI family protein [Cyclobacteriaceae bacterium]